MTDYKDTASEFPEEAAEFNGTAQAEVEVTQPNAVTPTPAPEQKNSVTIRDTQKSALMDPNLYIQMKYMAQDFIASKAIPQCWQSAAQVLVGLQTGLEMGMNPMEAMNSLYVVNGAVNVWGKATTNRLRAHGWHIKYTDETQEQCTATVWRGKNPVKPGSSDEQYSETFYFSDAEASGYTKDNSGRLKIGWREGMNRRKKLRYGVLALIISTHIPEVLGSAVGIVEVSDDYDLGTNNNPAQLADKSADRKAKMLAAETKRKELDNGSFKPSAVPQATTDGDTAS